MTGIGSRFETPSRRAFLGAGIAGAATFVTSASAIARTALADDPIAAELRPLIEAQALAGAGWQVRQHGRVISSGALGFADVERRVAMRPDTIFQIMSTSKVVIALAIELLRLRGAVDIDAPVSRYLPEFGGQWIARDEGADRRTLTRPARASTVADLLAHSSGLPDAPPNVGRFAIKMNYSLAEMAGIMSQQPLVYQPGSRFLYSNVGIAVAARIVEVVSGTTYADFVRRHILRPLGLKRMHFSVARADERRVANAYRADNGLTPMTDKGPGDGDLRFRRGARYVLPEAGLYATSDELGTLFQAILDDFNDNKARLLPRDALAAMLVPRIDMPDRDGVVRTRQGLGWRIAAVDGGNRDSPMGRAGSFGHSGALGSTAWIDPAAGQVAVLMIQTLPADGARQAFARGVARLTA